MTTAVQRAERKAAFRIRQGFPPAAVRAHYSDDLRRREVGNAYLMGYRDALVGSGEEIARAESRTRLRTIALTTEATRRQVAEEIARFLDDLDRTGEWGDVVRARYYLAPRWRA